MPHLKNRVLRGFRPIAIICIVFTAVFSVHRAFFSLATYKTHRKISLTEPTRSPTRYRGGVPIVDREKLAEVEDRMAYYAHLDGGDPNFREWVLPPNPYSPPKVTAIPEPPRKSKTHALELWPDEKADMQLCHEKTGCRLLLPTWIGEQESKGSRHVYQIGLLANQLNRTLVLPPMWKSRFGTCYRNPFSYYYHEKALSRFGVPSLTFEAFQLWTLRRFTPPRARVVEILSIISEYEQPYLVPHASVISTANPPTGKHNHCLAEKAARTVFTTPALSICPADPGWHTGAAQTKDVADAIVQRLAEDTNDVMAITWDLRYPLFPVSADAHLEYAPRWTEFAVSLSNNISPFIAVHWRMETVPANHMPACALALVSTINSILHLSWQNSISGSDEVSSDITTVYLATDYPLEGPDATPHSGTFKDVNDEHHAAIRVLKDAFATGGDLASLKLTSLRGEMMGRRDNVPFDGMDSGLMGILDKEVAIHADVFLAGHKSCSRPSSYTAQIISSRSQQVEAPDGEGMRNIVDYFGVRVEPS